MRTNSNNTYLREHGPARAPPTRRSSTSLSTAPVTATTIRLVKSASRGQNPSLTRSQTIAPERTSTLKPGDDPRLVHVRPVRVGAVRTDSTTSHL